MHNGTSSQNAWGPRCHLNRSAVISTYLSYVLITGHAHNFRESYLDYHHFKCLLKHSHQLFGRLGDVEGTLDDLLRYKALMERFFL